jgi:hypothetical protein
MDAQHDDEDWFDGLDASVEIPLDRGGSRTAKAKIRVSAPALFVLVLGVAVIRSEGSGLERLLDAVPALVQRVGDGLVAAA